MENFLENPCPAHFFVAIFSPVRVGAVFHSVFHMFPISGFQAVIHSSVTKNHVHVRDWGYRGVWHTCHTMSCLGRAPRTQSCNLKVNIPLQACIAIMEWLGGAYGSVRTPVKPESDGHQSSFARCPKQI